MRDRRRARHDRRGIRPRVLSLRWRYFFAGPDGGRGNQTQAAIAAALLDMLIAGADGAVLYRFNGSREVPMILIEFSRECWFRVADDTNAAGPIGKSHAL